MLNLYEILEVSEKASKEVIEKAYRVLAKKYHPDLQSNENKSNAENKMKQINEAYEVLSDDEKRKEYDLELDRQREEEKRIEQIEFLNNEQRKKQEVYNNQREDIRRNEYVEDEYLEDEYQLEKQRKIEKQEYDNMQKLQNEMNRAYAQAYNDYWRSRGYKIKEPWTLKRFIELIKVLGILAIIIAIIWFFPPTHKLLIDFYESNFIVKVIIDITGNILEGIWNVIIQFFQNTF